MNSIRRRRALTAVSEAKHGFAVWITGLPASGKSTVAAALASELRARNVSVEVLESDVLRRVFTPHPRYDEAERDIFYGQIAFMGALLARHGIAVIFDATANLRAYRDRARQQIPRFLEVYVDTPLEVCMSRDPKGIYRQSHERVGQAVPGLQAAYEPPLNPDLVIHGDQEQPRISARRILDKLAANHLISA
jgi:adenylylsulfate kinase